MKLVFADDVIYGYASDAPWAVGGAERQQWLLASALAAAGWSVRIGVREALKRGEHKIIDGVEFVGIGKGQILLAWYWFLISERPDWWYWRGADHLWGPGVEVARLTGVRTIFSAAFDSDVQPSRALSRRRHWWPLYAWGLSRTDRIFVQHAGQLAGLAPQWRSKANIVPGIARVATGIKPHAARAKYVAWVGMLRQSKRPDLLIEIARKAPTLRFVVCGGPTAHRSPPGYGEQIVDALNALPNVKFVGRVDPGEAERVIADAAILLSTSDGEGFPNAFLQAWSSGTPVISLKIDPDNIIERFGLGRVSSSVGRAISDINTLMDSPSRREKIARSAREYIAEAHSQSTVISAFERAIRGAP